MSDSNIHFIQESLLWCSTSGPLNILEWGSGGSTVHYPAFLRSRRVDFRWTSIEHSPRWHATVTEQLKGLDADVTVHLVPFTGTKSELRLERMNEYVRLPLRLSDDSYDVILVDGWKRARCLLVAREVVKVNGLVFLHDAQRTWYHRSFPVFGASRFVDFKLWLGRRVTPTVRSRAADQLNYILFRLGGKILSQKQMRAVAERVARVELRGLCACQPPEARMTVTC